jgi:hypothetical protein
MYNLKPPAHAAWLCLACGRLLQVRRYQRFTPLEVEEDALPGGLHVSRQCLVSYPQLLSVCRRHKQAPARLRCVMLLD